MLLTIDELAAFLRLSKETVYKMAQRGEIPAIKLRAQWRFDQEQIDQWLRENSNRRFDDQPVQAEPTNRNPAQETET